MGGIISFAPLSSIIVLVDVDKATSAGGKFRGELAAFYFDNGDSLQGIRDGFGQ